MRSQATNALGPWRFLYTCTIRKAPRNATICGRVPIVSGADATSFSSDALQDGVWRVEDVRVGEAQKGITERP